MGEGKERKGKDRECKKIEAGREAKAKRKQRNGEVCLKQKLQRDSAYLMKKMPSTCSPSPKCHFLNFLKLIMSC